MGRKSATNLVNKIKEADFFLSKMLEPHRDLSTAGYLFSAFVSSARSVSFVVQYLGSDCVGFDEWYEKKQSIFKKCQVCGYLLGWRNFTQKTGVVPIASGGYYEGQEDKVKYYFSHQLGETPDIGAEKTVNFYCYLYMLRMIELAHEFFELFESSFHDPAEIRSRILQIDDDSIQQYGVPVFGQSGIEKYIAETPSKKLKMMTEKYRTMAI